MNRRRRLELSSGFTMIELMIATVVIGIATTMAVPGLQKVYERSQYRAAVRNITSTLRVARSTAIANKTQIGVLFNENTRTVTTFTDKVNPEDYVLESGDSVLSIDTLPPLIVWLGTDCTNNTLAFEPNGSCGFSGGGNLYTLAYSNNMVAFHSSNVVAATGRVSTNYNFY